MDVVDNGDGKAGPAAVDGLRILARAKDDGRAKEEKAPRANFDDRQTTAVVSTRTIQDLLLADGMWNREVRSSRC